MENLRQENIMSILEIQEGVYVRRVEFITLDKRRTYSIQIPPNWHIFNYDGNPTAAKVLIHYEQS